MFDNQLGLAGTLRWPKNKTQREEKSVWRRRKKERLKLEKRISLQFLTTLKWLLLLSYLYKQKNFTHQFITITKENNQTDHRESKNFTLSISLFAGKEETNKIFTTYSPPIIEFKRVVGYQCCLEIPFPTPKSSFKKP